jgi:hypothetical protein
MAAMCAPMPAVVNHLDGSVLKSAARPRSLVVRLDATTCTQ